MTQGGGRVGVGGELAKSFLVSVLLVAGMMRPPHARRVARTPSARPATARLGASQRVRPRSVPRGRSHTTSPQLLTRRRSPSPISPRSVSPVSTRTNRRSRSPEEVIRASPLRQATSRGVQRGVPRSRRERTGWDLELRRWCLSREIRQLRSTARRVLLALTVMSVSVAIVLNFDWPATILLAGSEGAAKMTCPANSVLKDDRCLATEVECPPGSSRVEDHCVALQVDCPDGSVHVGERCVVSTLNKPAHYAVAERLACSSVGVAGVYVVLVSLVGATAVVAWRNRPKPQRYRCLHDAAMTAERDFLPAHYGSMTTLATVGHVRQGEVVTVRRIDTSRPTQQRRAQLESGYWVSLVSQQGERLFTHTRARAPPPTPPTHTLMSQVSGCFSASTKQRVQPRRQRLTDLPETPMTHGKKAVGAVAGSPCLQHFLRVCAKCACTLRTHRAVSIVWPPAERHLARIWATCLGLPVYCRVRGTQSSSSTRWSWLVPTEGDASQRWRSSIAATLCRVLSKRAACKRPARLG